jgi:hypothetical protein
VQVYRNHTQTTNATPLKLKVLLLILITTIGIAVLDHYHMLGTTANIIIEARYLQYTCGKNNIDMRVVAVADTNYQFLVGQVIAPELLSLKQSELAQLIYLKTSPFKTGKQPTLGNFTLVGFLRNGSRAHCSGAICFKVEKIKYAGDSTFIRF